MKKYFRIGFLTLFVIFVLIQFIRPSKNISTGVQSKNISSIVPVNDTITGILRKACNDCHSNNTEYPWYFNIAPVSWFLNNHINEGKKHLNFDEYASYSPKRTLKKFDDINDEIEHDGMPLSSYTLIHNNAILTESEKKALISWSNNSKAIMQTKYNDTLGKQIVKP